MTRLVGPLQSVVRNRCAVACLVILLVTCVTAWCDENDASQPDRQFGKPVAGKSGESKKVLDGPELSDRLSWSEAIRAIVLTAIPDKYEDLSHWGETTEIFDGLNVKQRGFDIRVSQRKKAVNHGPWHRYRVEFVEPKKNLNLIIDNFRSTGSSQFQFDINLFSKLKCRGDFEHWVLGVKGFNVTVVSLADVQISANCELRFRTVSNRKSILPDLILEPRVKSVRLFLRNIDVERIGEIRGDIAESIGDGSRQFIEQLMRAQERRVLKKANEALTKKQDGIRIPMSLLW